MRGAELFDLIKAEGHALTPVDLKILRSQFQILDAEAARLEGEKRNPS